MSHGRSAVSETCNLQRRATKIFKDGDTKMLKDGVNVRAFDYEQTLRLDLLGRSTRWDLI